MGGSATSTTTLPSSIITMQTEVPISRGPVLVQNLQDYSGRIPPQAVEVEQHILGSILISDQARETAMAILSGDAFYLPKHVKIFKAITELDTKGQPVDLITVAQHLRSINQLEIVGGVPYLENLTELVATSANTEHHARIVVQKALLRKMIEAMSRRITQAYDPATDAFDLLDQAETDLFTISESQVRKSARNLTEILGDTIDHLQRISDNAGDISGVTSGFADLDQITGGWQNSDLIIIAGRPSMGKCVDADTPIVQSDGQMIRIADLYEQQEAHLLTLGEDQRFSATVPSAYHYDGYRPVYQVTTRLGRSVRTTITHPFLTPDGWEPLGDLSVGHSIAVPRELPIFGTATVPPFLTLQLTETILRPHQVSRPISGTKGTIVRSKALHVLPHWVFSLSPECLADFLGQLFAGRHSIQVSSGLLARQLAHLQLRFGTLTRVQKILDGWTVTLPGPQAKNTREHIVYDEIVQIKSLGLRPVYDLTIEETHNFVASDICVHNTAFALSCARNAAMTQQKPTSCAIFSLEMSARQLAQRFLTSEARINAQAARTGKLYGEDFEAVANAANKFSLTNIFIDDTAGMGILELRAKCRRLKSERGIGLVLVDYLQLMQGRSKDNREQEIATISRSLKELAKELDIPVIALSQLNRNAEDRKDKRPQLADLRESGAIEQDADVVAFIYRPSYYGIAVDNQNNSTEGVAEIIVGKHRNGPTGNVKLKFIQEYARFENLDLYHQPDTF